VPTPRLVGLTEPQAASAVKAAQAQVPPRGYFAYTPRASCNGNVDPAKFGLVYAQSPSAGTALTSGQAIVVDVYQSSCVAVPNVTGISASQARATLPKFNLQLGQVVTGTSCVPGAGGGIVTAQDQPAGAAVPAGTAVGLTVTPATCG
jgi:beta-lactam-binding protein with PASTA domain